MPQAKAIHGLPFTNDAATCQFLVAGMARLNKPLIGDEEVRPQGHVAVLDLLLLMMLMLGVGLFPSCAASSRLQADQLRHWLAAWLSLQWLQSCCYAGACAVGGIMWHANSEFCRQCDS